MVKYFVGYGGIELGGDEFEVRFFYYYFKIRIIIIIEDLCFVGF